MHLPHLYQFCLNFNYHLANNYVQEFNCEFPLDLGAKGSCHVGGNAATGAGGIYMVKHGSYRSYILGM